MKKITLGFSILAATTVFILGCNKKDNVAPEPDTELQSTKDISWANLVITDIDMICAYVAENNLSPKFYMPSSSNTGGQVTINRDTTNKYIFISFNKTLCMDGRLRDGSIAMNYNSSNPNAKYYRDYQFVGNITLLDYTVDGWKIGMRNTYFVKNLLASPNYSPSTTKLSWSLTGDFDLRNPADSTKNMHCNVNFVKTLSNTGTPTVFPVSKQAAINWSLAVCEYKGSVFGETSRTVPFHYSIDDAHPLVRDFTCYPDKVNGIVPATSSVTPLYEEYHPFVAGSASFTTSTLYPRQISYGNEQDKYGDVKNSPLVLTGQCDNSGVVTIKGISYPIDFIKKYSK